MLASAYELNKQLENKKKRSKQVFEKVLEACDRRIKNAVDVRAYECIFTVPRFVLGFPLYDLSECLEFVLRKLVAHGFITQVLEDQRSVHISWNVDKKKPPPPPPASRLPSLPPAPPAPPVPQGSSSRQISSTRNGGATAMTTRTTIAALKPTGRFVLTID
jgi:hypothetical protein